MPSTLVRLAVALLTFGLGVSATMFWIAYRTPDVKRDREMNLIKIAPRHPHALLPLPPLPTVEAPPPAPPAPPSDARAPISVGFINDRALVKPAPVYPSIAVVSNVSGKVLVQVLVDESGRVLTAEAVSGNPLLREAAVDAAFQARFAPMLHGGRAVKVSGIVSYNFVLP